MEIHRLAVEIQWLVSEIHGYAVEIHGYAGEIQHLVDCINQNKRPSVVTPEDGLNAIRICEAEARSVYSGQIESV